MTVQQLEITTWGDTEPVLDLLRRLEPARDVRELLATACELARRELPFDRAVVLTVAAAQLTVRDCGALQDPASDRLRRSVLARPVALDPDARIDDPVAVAGALDLAAPCVGVVAPSGAPLAVLVVDRDRPQPTGSERRAVSAFATVIAVALERTILRLRAAAIAGRLRHLTTTTQALVAELQDAPLALPSTTDHGALLAWDSIGGDGR